MPAQPGQHGLGHRQGEPACGMVTGAPQGEAGEGVPAPWEHWKHFN